MNKTYIHIGMPRTATTFFQHKVFPELSGYSYYGTETTHYSEVFNKLLYADDSFYDKTIFEIFLNSTKQNNLILSNELFCGQSTYFNFANRTTIANRLYELFPKANILLVLRNQIDLLQSLYAINVQWKETKKIDEFIWMNNSGKTKRDSGGATPTYFNTTEGYESLDGYDYNLLIKTYKERFENVTVLLFEEFLTSPTSFTEKLAAFFNLDKELVIKLISDSNAINEGVTKVQAEKLIKLNRFYEWSEATAFNKKIYNKFKRSILQNNRNVDKPRFSSEKTAELKTYFKPLNTKLNNDYPELGLLNYADNYYLEDLA
ncbi:MAG: hypothetical protein RQ875_10860 [Vicingaceae bacterium]|nr:hypothetical protein [Vicingaceae bacterium]